MKYKDKDHFEIALRLRTLPYALVCAGLGFMATVMLGVPIFQAILIALGAGVFGFLLPLMLAEKAGAAGASIYHSSGTSTPPIREYSLADSLAARGMLSEAAEAYQLLSEDYPLDPEPRVRLARLLRDRMQRGEDAVMWFRSAIMIKDIDSTTEISLVRELSELYTHRLRTPEKALPWLSRLAEKYPQHASGIWARAEMAEIRQAMKERND
jgi:hypothetical protein